MYPISSENLTIVSSSGEEAYNVLPLLSIIGETLLQSNKAYMHVLIWVSLSVEAL